ncbi:unnamed protein product [Pleuronectes platessa]|uniref:Uncharacterized protein n=1 Tax=Pleuronectes platessa TaxID=8262 RepID=A0A9N7UVX2_PLEPL|nr:unnamed protein product [Pleuronectes platessa]
MRPLVHPYGSPPGQAESIASEPTEPRLDDEAEPEWQKLGLWAEKVSGSSLVRLHGETTKDEPGLICPKIQESPYPV